MRYPEPKTGPRAAVHSRDTRTKASALLTSLALAGLSLHQVRRPLGKSIVPGQLDVRYQAVHEQRDPDSGVFTLRRFRVDSGQPVVIDQGGPLPA